MRLRAVCLPLSVAALLGGCATAADVVDETYVARLFGEQEAPGPGDPDGRGTAEVTIIDAADQVCYEIDVENIGTPTAAHIHRGRLGESGPPVVPFNTPFDGERDGCATTTDAIADEIENDPSNFYVNVHTAEYPNGAIRGQLRDID